MLKNRLLIMKAKEYLLTLPVLILANGNAGSHQITFYLVHCCDCTTQCFLFIFFFPPTTEVTIAIIIVQDDCIFNTENLSLCMPNK